MLLLVPLPSLAAAPVFPGTLRAGAPVTASERQALSGWAFAQPAARRLAGHRLRVLAAGTDAEGKGGGERALLYVRDYDTGGAFEIAIDLERRTLALISLKGLIQPSREEIDEAIAIARREPELAALLSDPSYQIAGGFLLRSPDSSDPCFRDVCLHLEVLEKRRLIFARRLVVDLSRGLVANRNFPFTLDPEVPPAMTEPSRRPSPEGER